ncbi:hypothetical protein CSX11_19325 [Mycobacterium goodii]|nr:hypothetical protein CSX11_19325 [Mycolicibacterium goodii]
MRTNWLSRLAVKYRRAYEPRNRPGVRDVDARRVSSELDAIRARFPDHA